MRSDICADNYFSINVEQNAQIPFDNYRVHGAFVSCRKFVNFMHAKPRVKGIGFENFPSAPH